MNESRLPVLSDCRFTYESALHFYSRVRRMKKLVSAQLVMLELTITNGYQYIIILNNIKMCALASNHK